MFVLAILVGALTLLAKLGSRFWNFIIKPELPKNYVTYVKKDSSKATAEDGSSKNHPFFRNCEKPTTTPVYGEVQGEIPKWLNGTLVRNGPGIMKIGEDVYNHMFDGLSVLHRYHVSEGKATYTSRALESDTYKMNMAANRIVVSEFGTVGFPDPCKTIFQRLQSTFESATGKKDMTDNCTVTVGWYGDQLYAMTETNAMRRIDPETLHSIGDKTRINDYVAVSHASAHPHTEEDGTVLNVGTNYRQKGGPHYVVVKVPPTFGSKDTCYEGASVVAEIPLASKRFPSYYHSFGITKDKIIFIECPLKLDILKLLRGSFVNTSFKGAMTWDPTIKTRIHVASLTDGKIHPVVYEADPFFTFHHINAFEEDGQLVVDVAAYDNGDLVLNLENDNVNKISDYAQKATARRFILPLNVENAKEGTNLVTISNSNAKATLQGALDSKPVVFCEPQHLSKDWMELPRINYKLNTKQYRYFYAITSVENLDWTILSPDALAKVDIKTNEVLRWSEKGLVPSEPIFVANPDAKDEDDGVVLTALMHENEEKRVTLLILNAKDMKELARVKFEIDGAFTGTFHGQWANQADKIHLY